MSGTNSPVAIFTTTVVAAPLLLVIGLGLPVLLGRALSERTIARMVATTCTVGLIATLIVFGFMVVDGSRHVELAAGEWVHIHNPPPDEPYHFAVKFVFDRLSTPFVALTFVLLGTIAAFANRYMHRETGFNRFFALYSLFLFGMIVAALSGTIETLFFGWELVGLSSALLVGYYHERPAPVRNALRVWVVYRISDAALLFAAIFLHHLHGEGDFDHLTGYRVSGAQEFAAWPYGISELKEFDIWIVGGLLLLAAAGKSALVPFSGWLPRAMEGPTPSSAVFYGALSVHLGAYMLLRISPLLDASPELSIAVLVIGLLTAAMAALIGRVQTDIKSALSYASLTQVGLIVAEIGIGWRYIPLVHLLGHACLRTLQFVRAPSVIRDHQTIENAIGARLPRGSTGWLGAIGSWFYRFSIERGYLDAMLDRFIVQPVVGIFRFADRLEKRIVRIINGIPPTKESEAQS